MMTKTKTLKTKMLKTKVPKKITVKAPSYSVKKSAIHGKGLFARRAIRKDEIIGTIQYQATQTDGPYVLWLDETRATLVDCDLKYINHNKKPNASYCEDLHVVALKNIKVGDEITHDYGDDWA